MTDEQHIAGQVAGEDRLDFPDDACLGIDGPFPTSPAEMRHGEELVGDGLEFGWRQEAGRGAVVLMHGLPDFEFDLE